MQGKIYEIPLDISNGVLTTQIRELVTEDMGTNTFRFKVVKDNHVPYDFTGTTVRMMVKTPSGARIQQECTIENAVGGTLALTLKQSLLLEQGSYVAELQIYDAITQSIRLTTPTFSYHVRESLQNSESIVATDEYTILQQALADLAGINIVVANKADKDYVDGLNNALVSQLNKNATDLTAHKAEDTTQIVSVQRDISLEGELIVSLTPNKTAKSVIINAGIINNKSFSAGFANANRQEVVGFDANGNVVVTNATIYIKTVDGAYNLGSVTFQKGSIKITWQKTGSPTGNIQMRILASYHGGN